MEAERNDRTILMEPVTLAFAGRQLPAATRNVSPRGLCVDTSSVLARGEIIGVSFNRSGSETYRVVWSNVYEGRFRSGLTRQDIEARAA